jgi:antirestriction protein ArdC
MPNRADFYDTPAGGALEAFYSVLFHEHVHWTGHSTRLARDLTGRFGSSSYALEELVAELGAAFLCGTLGISTFPRPDHASYIQSWIKVLKEQKTAIFAAAGAASAAAQFLEGLAAENMQPEPVYVFNPA